MDTLEAMSLVSFAFQMMKQRPRLNLQGHTTKYTVALPQSILKPLTSALTWITFLPPHIQGFFLCLVSIFSVC